MRTSNKKKFKTLFVDMDGTLVDSMQFLFDTYMDFLHQWEVKGSIEEFRELIGVSFEEIVDRLIKTYSRNEKLNEEVMRYRSLLNELPVKAKVFPHASEMLKKVKNSGMTLAIVTSAEQHLAEDFIKKNEMNPLFDAIIGTKHGSRGKPDPQLYVEALKLTSTLPHEAIAIEDSLQGLLAASGAGIEVIHFASNQVPFKNYRSMQNWNELAKILEIDS